MKKVLFVGHDARRTGAPLYLLHLAKWIKNNSDLSFEFLLREKGPLFEEFQLTAPTRWLDRGAVHPSKLSLFQRLQRRRGYRPLAVELRHLYPAAEFPLIYSNTIANGEVVREFAAAGQRVICHAHEMRTGYTRWGGKHLPAAAKLTDLFIATSLAVRRDLQEELEVPAGKIELVNGFGQPPAISEAQFRETRVKFRQQLGLSEDTIAIGMCGTVDWRKGADLLPTLVSTVKKLQSPSQTFRFFWIGAEPESQECLQVKHDLRQLGVGEMVTLINIVPNPQEYFTALDLFALLSREDPFPLVMLEAAALAIPLVCFEKSGGAEELVADGAGVSVPYLDVEQFARAIVKLGSDETLRREMGQKAKTKTYSQFTLETQGPKLLAIIQRFLAQTK